MSDEQNSGTEVPPSTPAPSGEFDWLLESHQQSAPMAPLTDDVPSPAPAPLSFGLPDPAARPAATTSFDDLFSTAVPARPVESPTIFAPPVPAPVAAAPPATPLPVTPLPVTPLPATPLPVTPLSPTPVSTASLPVSQPPVVPAPIPPVAEVQAPPPVAPTVPVPRQAAPPPDAPTPVPTAPVAPLFPSAPASAMLPTPAPAQATDASVFSFVSEPLAPASFAGALGAPALSLERHSGRPRSGTGAIDWVAFVLAFLAPPIGLLIGIGAVFSDSRSKGYVAGIAKAAIGIGAVLTIVLGVAFAVVTKMNNDQAAHAAIAVSSRAYCAKLESNKQALSSDTFGWPSPGNTIPSSITAMKVYQATWESLAKLAPPGIHSDTAKVAATAASIIESVKSTQTLNDAGNVAQLQNVVATSGIRGWVSSYCN